MGQEQETLDYWVSNYQNTAEKNEFVHREFTKLTDTVPWLKEHRDIIEQNQWGFGDRAFHFMWYLLLRDLQQRFPNETIHCLEIGVFKGQTISLWSRIGAKLGVPLHIAGLGPLRGSVSSDDLIHRAIRKVKGLLGGAIAEGNAYLDMDYRPIVEQVFNRFTLNFSELELIQGYSTDPSILKSISQRRFHLIYIDGDHSYEGASHDIVHFSPLVVPQGYLVTDDSSFFLPGKGFFKGFEAVSRAIQKLDTSRFENILNAGHNRVFRRLTY